MRGEYLSHASQYLIHAVSLFGRQKEKERMLLKVLVG